MQCEKCGFDNPPGMRYCGQCASPLQRICPACQFANPPLFKFCGQCGAALQAEAPSPVAAEEPQRQEAERRQLSVLFCDMVGSSALSERIDPEELRDIMRGYRNTCNDVVERFGGHVAQYLGDGILVYFGYPQAHEDDARRATQAALEIASQVPLQAYPVHNGGDEHLSVRIGVHTGLVVIGEMGDGDKRTMALGETPNIAARVQGLSTPNSVVVSEATWRLIADDFDVEPLGRHQLKGFTHPMDLYRILGEHSLEQRLRPGPSVHNEPLVGRDQETALVMERLDQARKGVGQVVLLGGEAGLGKTRMVQMVYERLEDEPCFIMECGGSPYYQNSFLHPIIDVVQRTLGLQRMDDPALRLARLEEAIATLGLDISQTLPAMAELLAIPLPGYGPQALGATPQQRKRRVLETVVTVLQTLAEQRLVVLVVEDLHWVDASTLELLGLLVERPGLTNIFALFTFRNEFAPPWKSHANLTLVTLNRLTRQQSGHLVRQLAKGKTLPMDVFAEIQRKADGVPYFIEELTHMVLASDMLEEKANHFELRRSLAELAIPSTLQDSLMSRLDALGEDKELAQLSATLGREFAHELLSAVADRDENSLQRGLNHLINAELFLQRGRAPNAYYSFRHALLREAAYQSLLRRTRQQYHRRIAGRLKEHFPQIIETNPELLAHHCAEAGEDQEAVDLWLTAGELAVQHSANQEAVSHLQNGLTVLQRLPDSPARKGRELALQTTLGLAQMMGRGYAADEVEKAYARAHELCNDIQDVATRFPVLCGLWEYYIVRADLATAETLALELQALGQSSARQDVQREAQRTLGSTRFWQGRLSEALALLLPSAQPDGGTNDEAHLGHCQDVRVASLANAGCIHWLQGRPEQALALCRRALELAKTLAHPFSQAYALQFLAVLHQLRGETDEARRRAEAQIALGETYGFAFWSATGRMLRAWATAGDDAAAACEAFRQALLGYEASGSRLVHSYFLCLLADLQYRSGEIDSARATIEQALSEGKKTEEGFFLAELLRLRARFDATQEQPNTAALESALLAALQQAREQEAHGLALRSAIDLASCWQRQGRTQEAEALLTESLGHIEGGGQTGDVRRAHTLMA